MRAESGGHAVTGLGSGFIDLDDKTGGFHPGQLIVLAARPSMGKTALALNISDHVAVELNVPVLFVSLEMGHIEIADRLLSARSRVDGNKIKRGIGLGPRDLTGARQGLSGAFRTRDVHRRHALANRDADRRERTENPQAKRDRPAGRRLHPAR